MSTISTRPCPVSVRTMDRANAGGRFDQVAAFLGLLMANLDEAEAINFHYGRLIGRDAVQSYVSKLTLPTRIEYKDGSVAEVGPYLMVARVFDLIDRKNIIHAFLNGCNSDLSAGEAAIVFNLSGAFWNPSFSVGRRIQLRGGTKMARAFIVLHEFCHALDCSGFKPDYGNQSAGASNDRLVEVLFPRTIRAIGRARM